MKLIEKLENDHPHMAPIIYQLLSSFCFAAIGLTTKLLSKISPGQILYVRSIIGFLAQLIISQIYEIGCYPKNNQVVHLLEIRGILGGLGTVAFFQSFQLAQLSECIVLSKLSPLWTALISCYILKTESVTFQLFINILISIVGVIMIAQPPQLLYLLSIENNNKLEYPYHFAGICCALFFSFTSAIAQIAISKMGKKVDTIVIFQYFSFFTMMSPMIYQMYSPFQQLKIPDYEECFYLLLNALAGYFAQFYLNKSFTVGDLNQLAIIGQSQVFFSFLIDIFILKQPIDSITLIGAILVCSCLFNVIRRKKMNNQLK